MSPVVDEFEPDEVRAGHLRLAIRACVDLCEMQARRQNEVGDHRETERYLNVRLWLLSALGELSP